jgi:hypothetical protein
MFALLRQQQLSYLGGEGVGNGQGPARPVYGDIDKSERLGDKSGMGEWERERE